MKPGHASSVHVAAVLVMLAVLVPSAALAQSPLFQRPDSAFFGGTGFLEMEPLIAADLDGDGDIDLICRDGVRLNDGSGRFRLHPVPTMAFAGIGAGGQAGAVVLGDFDHDGDLDAIVTMPNAAPSLLLNDGTGAFVAAAAVFPLPAPPSGTPCIWTVYSVVAGDLDGDGRVDLAGIRSVTGGTQCGGIPQPFFWRNLGGGVFVDVTAALLPTGVLSSIVDIYDEDGDGDGDVVAVDGNLNFGFYRNTGAGGLVLFQALGPGGLAARGDFDGSGSSDDWLVMSISSGGTARVETIYFHGPSGFSAGGSAVWCLNEAHGLLALDLNGDGIDEVVHLGVGESTVYGVSGGTVQSAPWQQIFAGVGSTRTVTARGALAADYDGDGDRDLIGVAAGGEAQLWFANGTNRLLNPRPSVPGLLAAHPPVHLCDFDGDGDLDLVGEQNLGACHGGVIGPNTVSASSNAGFGRFDVPVTGGLVGFGTNFSDSGPNVGRIDYNGDGNLDLLVPAAGGRPYVLLGDGSGHFLPQLIPAPIWDPPFFPTTPVPPFYLPTGTCADVLVKDVDGDGRNDVLMLRWPLAGPSNATPGVSSLHLVRNPAPGVWVGPTFLGGAHAAYQLATGDFDGDGQPDDFVMASQSQNPPADPCVLILNQGGTYVEVPLPPAIEARSVAAGDLDGDGDDDLVIDGVPYLHLSGTSYVAGTPLVSPSTTANPFDRSQLVDLDGDGALDLLVLEGWFKGLGNGGFGAYEAILPAPANAIFRMSYSVADLDGDGDPDLVDAAGRVYWNATRQLARGSLAAPGRVASLDVIGPPGAPYTLVASLGLASTPIPLAPWGTVFIDPASAVIVTNGSLSASGTGSLSLAVPNVTSLISLIVQWQAAFPSQVRFSGLATTQVLRL